MVLFMGGGVLRVVREKSEEKAENKKRPDVDKFHVTVLRRSFVCVKISYLGSLSPSPSLSLKRPSLSLSSASPLCLSL